MDGRSDRRKLRAAADEHRRLRRLAAAITADDLEAVLGLGSAVVLHGLVEEDRLYHVHRYLDPAVRRQLIDEHREIGRHLELLEQLREANPKGHDLETLSIAVLDRLQRHLERDERVVYRPLRRLETGL